MKIPKGIEKVVEGFERLPGIGPKSAQRLAFYLLHVPQEYLDEFANSVSGLKQSVVICKTCFNIGDTEECAICSDPSRDSSTICVVEDALDVIALEKSGKYKGLYHVLHGVVDPLNGLGPNDIYIPQLLERVKREALSVKELIIATNPTMEGEATAMYITNQLKTENSKLKITRIGHGLPIGSDIEYADEVTLQRAMEGRREY
jgi:recombination protein RecR